MYCQRCGNQVRNDARFCAVCGAQVDASVPGSGKGNAPSPSQQPIPASGYPAQQPYQAQPRPLGYPQPAPYGQPSAQQAYPQPVQHLQPLPAPPQQAPYGAGYPQAYYQQSVTPPGYPGAQAAQPANATPNQYPQPVPPGQSPQNAPGSWQRSSTGFPAGSLVAPIIAGATYPAFGRRAVAFLIDISLVFLFIAAAIVRNTRRVRVLLASSHPMRAVFASAAKALAP